MKSQHSLLRDGLYLRSVELRAISCLRRRTIRTYSQVSQHSLLRWCGVLCLLMAGCADEATIRHYQVSRVQPDEKSSMGDGQNPSAPQQPATPQRMLGSVLPIGSRAWFVKATGAPEAVAAQVDAFEAFVKSWQLDAPDAEPKWQVPAGWNQRSTAGPMRFATFDAAQVEISVTMLPLPSQQPWEEYLASNVNRWRGQLSLEPASPEEIRASVRTVAVHGQNVTLVDLQGTSTGGSSAMGMMGSSSGSSSTSPASPAAPADPHAGLPGFDRSATTSPAAPAGTGGGPSGGTMDFDVPAGWQPGRLGAFRLAAFEIMKDGKRAEVTLSALGTQSGTLLENVNQWRSSLGLNAIEETQLAPLLSSVPIGDRAGQFVDLTQEESEAGLLGTILPLEDRTLYVKIVGDRALVQEQRAAFEQFVRSLRPANP